MPAKRWTRKHREAFKRTIAAKRESRVKRSQVLALEAPIQQDEITLWDGQQLVKCRLESMAVYVKSE